MAKLQSFSIFRGEDAQVAVTLDPVVDITGWALAFYLRKYPELGTSPLITRTTGGSGIVITDGAASEFTITIPAASTSALNAGRYRFDIWRTDSGSSKVLVYGFCDFLPQARHDAV